MAEKIQKKSNLFLMPDRRWASSPQVVAMVEDVLKRAKAGHLQSFAYVAERTDESMERGATRVNNSFGMAGYLFSMGMTLMGFEDTRKSEPPDPAG